jgi:hypothetical protein
MEEKIKNVLFWVVYFGCIGFALFQVIVLIYNHNLRIETSRMIEAKALVDAYPSIEPIFNVYNSDGVIDSSELNKLHKLAQSRGGR